MQPMISAVDNDNVSRISLEGNVSKKAALVIGDVQYLIPLNNSSHNSKHEWWFVFPTSGLKNICKPVSEN